jgi:hypothetical protein
MRNAGDNIVLRQGEVISVKDPYRMFRAQVRVFGMTDDKRGIPDEDLPWYTSMFPVSSASLAGVGGSSALEPGSKVFVMILDYPSCQHGVIIGSHYPGPSSPSHVHPLAKGQRNKGPKIPNGPDGKPIDLGYFGNVGIIDRFDDIINKIKKMLEDSQIFKLFQIFKIGDK